MRVLVVGGEGYLGSVLCDLLADRHDVTSVDVGWFPTRRNPRVRYVTADVFAYRDLAGLDAIVCLAGLSNDPMADRDPRTTFALNVGLPFDLGKRAREAGVGRVVYASTCSAYGFQDALLTEASPTLATTYYGMSKLQGEEALLRLAGPTFRVVAFRLGTLSGTSPRMRFDLLANTMCMCARRDGKITVNDPGIWRPILHVRDAARAMALAVERAEPLDGVYNLATGNHTVGEVAEAIRAKHPCEVVTKDVRDNKNYRVSCARVRALPFTFDHGLDGIIDDLLAAPAEDYADERFYNIKVYERLGSPTRSWPEP